MWFHHFMANRRGKSGSSDRFYLPGLQNNCACDYSREIKRCLLLGRKALTILDSTLKSRDKNKIKSRDIILPTKVRPVKALGFPVIMYQCESWTKERAEHMRIDASELWCWRTFGLQDQISESWRKSTLNIHWKDWCWSWSSSTLAT